jgi:5'-deoxynucleotidase YfbR-like HD superfamily hydrolase
MTKEDNWIQTFCGKKAHIFNLQVEEIDINDIAHSLSLICRFNGHCKEFYSVADHSIRVCEVVEDQLNFYEPRLLALVHDAQEIYASDVPRPVKQFLTEYKELEESIARVIRKHFGLSEESYLQFSKIIKKADDILLATEARDLMVTPPDNWVLSEKPLFEKIIPLTSKKAEELFLDKFYSIIGSGTGV